MKTTRQQYNKMKQTAQQIIDNISIGNEGRELIKIKHSILCSYLSNLIIINYIKFLSFPKDKKRTRLKPNNYTKK
jgi:hypothetical protein